ncbi:viral CC-type chemokine [Finch poxvirus]|uniref:Viral CC-type chemokine n=2 Tax=unclassified Avipoxvirus TaxID=336487 RepID=A0AAT9UQM8_9POXV|nr:viral CC-type chemokine [Finch poxvirus]UOX39054.1 viral CC-type chemokine [Finch poxvirus]
MYSYNKLILIAVICMCSYNIVCSLRPQCDKRCCDNAKVYDKKIQERELCRFKCYMKYVLEELKCNSNEDALLQCFKKTNNNMPEKLEECLKKCPGIPPEGCKKTCCNQRDLIIERRKNDPKACCDGHNQVKNRKVRKNHVIDCRTSDPSCNEKGYLLLYPDNTTACLPSDASNTDLGSDFPHSDECWQLDNFLQDRNQNYWKTLD